MVERYTVAFLVRNAEPQAEAVRILRLATGKPVKEVTAALRDGVPIDIRPLFHSLQPENEPVILSALRELEALGGAVDVFVSGRHESKEYLLNILQRHHEVAYDLRMESELESGEPSEQAQVWASGNFVYTKRGT